MQPQSTPPIDAGGGNAFIHGMTSVPGILTDLNDRSREVFRRVVEGYLETGEPIGLARLLARPTATLSLEAQQRRELKQKMFGD